MELGEGKRVRLILESKLCSVATSSDIRGDILRCAGFGGILKGWQREVTMRKSVVRFNMQIVLCNLPSTNHIVPLSPQIVSLQNAHGLADYRQWKEGENTSWSMALNQLYFSMNRMVE